VLSNENKLKSSQLTNILEGGTSIKMNALLHTVESLALSTFPGGPFVPYFNTSYHLDIGIVKIEKLL